jgi:uncharacterized protein (DUF1684 family)
MDANDRRPAWILALLVGVVVLAGCAPRERLAPAPVPGNEADRWERAALEWRERRLTRLTEPYGWLSLVGLHFLDDGEWRLGRSGNNDYVLPAGPERWGTLTVMADRAWFDPEPGTRIRVDGRSLEPPESVAFYPEGHPEANRIAAASVELQLLERSGQLVLRVRDSQAPTRTGFAGLDYFPFAPQWRIEADWQAHPAGRTLLVANVLGELVEEPNPGAVEFEIDGRRFGLEAIDSDDDLFFVFADRTSGRETYGLGRFLYADWPIDGKVVLDFNRAYNPPCSFTEFSTCPLPPPENRLDVPIEAGELAPSAPLSGP